MLVQRALLQREDAVAVRELVQVHVLQLQLHLVGLELRRIKDLLYDAHEPVCLLGYRQYVVALLIVERAELPAVEQGRKALYVRQRSLELVRYIVYELRLEVAVRLELACGRGGLLYLALL